MSEYQENQPIGNFVASLSMAAGLGIGGGGFLGMLWGEILEHPDGPEWGAAIGFVFCIVTLLYSHFRGVPNSEMNSAPEKPVKS